jgi:membrane associated rhomboid family serine protease
MYNPNANASPFNDVPIAAIGLAMVMAAVEIVFQAADLGLAGGAQGVGWRIGAFNDYAFFGPIWDQMWDLKLFPVEQMIRFVTYPFLHGTFFHAAFAVVIVLAIGKAVGEVFSTVAFLVVFFSASILGALVFAIVTDTNSPLIGGYPGGYGLIGAFTFLLWTRLAAVGANSYRAFTLIGMLMGIQLVFGALLGGSPDWIADLAGFVVGFLLSFVVSPGGWAHVVDRLRQR